MFIDMQTGTRSYGTNLTCKEGSFMGLAGNSNSIPETKLKCYSKK